MASNSSDRARGGLFDGTGTVATPTAGSAATPNGQPAARNRGGFFGGSSSASIAPTSSVANPGVTADSSAGGLFTGPTGGLGVPGPSVTPVGGVTEDASRGSLFSGRSAGTQVVQGNEGPQGIQGLRGQPGTPGISGVSGFNDDQMTPAITAPNVLSAVINGTTYFLNAVEATTAITRFAISVSSIVDYSVFSTGDALTATVSRTLGAAGVVTSVQLDGVDVDPLPTLDTSFTVPKPYSASSHSIAAQATGSDVRTELDGSTTDLPNEAPVSDSVSWTAFIPDYWVASDSIPDSRVGTEVRAGQGATVSGTQGQAIYLITNTAPGTLTDASGLVMISPTQVQTFAEVDTGGVSRAYIVYQVAFIGASGSTQIRRS